jgi:two-component system sensor histidine kinase ChvG
MTTLDRPGPRPAPAAPDAAPAHEQSVQAAASPRQRRFSALTLRVLAPNVLALGVLAAGIFYLDSYRDSLLDAKVAALQTQAQMMAGAVGQSALAGPISARRLDAAAAGAIVARLAQPARVRVRLYGRDGRPVADSRDLDAAGRQVHLRYLPPPDPENRLIEWLNEFYDWLLPRLPRKENFPPYREPVGGGGYAEVDGALAGRIGGAVRAMADGTLIITVAVPVEELRQVVGALMLSTDSRDIEDGVRGARVAILQAFAVALAVTVLMSLFLAGTIARPVRILAAAADRVRYWRGRRVEIPDLSARRDEIGDLSVALGEMTRALYARLDAIEVFAADVAHEIKNPITSLRSALETLANTTDPERRERLLAVMMEDVRRLDRLISDISNASRIDAEMSRAEAEPVDLAELLRTAAAIHEARRPADGPVFALDMPEGPMPHIVGVPGRLGQVVDNLITNAVTFSPPGGTIRLSLSQRGRAAMLTVDDDGPGIPPGREEAIFQRFYTERPVGRGDGRHSGLGLSICRQIVEAHGGSIHAENRIGDGGRSDGARFVVELPLN